MARAMWLLVCTFAVLAFMASANVVQHTFRVGNLTVNPLCEERVIVAVNGQFPGPTIRVQEGDTLVVHVINESPYNISIHWHGIFQKLSAWADGPAYVTQCPMVPGNSYTYRFNVTAQEGTLWWHAHVSLLRATVYGALIIHPRAGRSYPFIKPHKEFPIVIGEWWNANVVDVEDEATLTGGAPNISNAYTINGRPGDLYPCTSIKTHKIEVVQGKTYMLRIINAAISNQHFFKIAGHNLTVVGIDATYTEPYVTNVVVVAPGQTADVLFVANGPPGAYYIAARPYATAQGIDFDDTTTTAILQYKGPTSSATPLMPVLPALFDTPTAHRFYSNLTALRGWGHKVPLHVDEHMFMTVGFGLEPCEENATCAGLNGMRFAASLNNASFRLPTTLSMLQAHHSGVQGIFTDDFPDTPPLVFDYTNANASQLVSTTLKSTRAKRLAYNSTVEIVFQNTAIVGVENHPMHLHGFNFYVLAQGFGNYDSATHRSMFNLVNPQVRNTIAVPVGGWAVVRFRANNPGVWQLHCHLDAHLTWGLSTAFVVDNGPTASSTLPPPPPDLPRC
ncbi:laccase-7-like [Magnolia sinica]|uniref:laccase-7-like n=1 Tax=Magnolia sinica TaxID=86752 RepID=UPI0026580075|nr:laccase-7-like [Magnolia sinica]